MEEAEKELERRSKFLNSLIQNKKKATQQQHQHQNQQKQQDQEQEQEKEHDKNSSMILSNIHVRACDMSLTLQKHAFQCARDHLDSKPSKKIDSKHLALALKKVHTTFFENFLLFFILSYLIHDLLVYCVVMNTVSLG